MNKHEQVRPAGKSLLLLFMLKQYGTHSTFYTVDVFQLWVQCILAAIIKEFKAICPLKLKRKPGITQLNLEGNSTVGGN